MPGRVSELLAALERDHGETEIFVSVITVIELEHGLYRASTEERAQKRRDYLDTVFAAPAEPFNREMARLAAKIDADTRKRGQVIPFPDLLIGTTALQFDYSLGTQNLRHFQMIPNLRVVRL